LTSTLCFPYPVEGLPERATPGHCQPATGRAIYYISLSCANARISRSVHNKVSNSSASTSAAVIVNEVKGNVTQGRRYTSSRMQRPTRSGWAGRAISGHGLSRKPTAASCIVVDSISFPCTPDKPAFNFTYGQASRSGNQIIHVFPQNPLCMRLKKALHTLMIPASRAHQSTGSS
jgi:hypothetical protein